MGVQCEQERAKHRALLVSSTNVEEVWLPIRTVSSLFVRESNIKLHGLVLKHRVLSFSNQVNERDECTGEDN